jgi:hypothetical protein
MALSMVKNESDASDAEDSAQEADPASLATCLAWTLATAYLVVAFSSCCREALLTFF